MMWLRVFPRLFVFVALVGAVAGCSNGVNFSERLANVAKKPPKRVVTPPHPGTRYEFRDLRIATDSEEFRPLIKVGLVLDNSRSMLDEQSALSEGFLNLLQSFRNDRMNLKFLIFTTSQVGSKRATEDFTEYRYTDGEGQLVVTADPTILEQQISGLVRRTGTRLAAPQLAAGSLEPLEIRTDMSEADFDGAVARIRSTVQNVGIAGPDEERGLCTLGRMLSEDSTLRKIFDPQDLAALMVVSDANDADSENNCFNFTDQQFGPSNNFTPISPTNCRPEDANCTQPEATSWQYVVAYFGNQDDWTQVWYYPVACVIDGQRREPCTDPNFLSYFWVPVSQLPAGTPLASSSAPPACTPNMVSWINSTNGREDVRAPNFSGERVCSYYTYRSQQNRYYTDGVSGNNYLSQNLCQPSAPITLTIGGVTRTANDLGQWFAPDLPNHSFSTCFSTFAPGWNWTTGSGPDVGGRYRPEYGPNAPTVTTSIKKRIDDSLLTEFPMASANLKEAIYRKANKVFGSAGYIASMIVNSPDLDAVAQEQGYELSCGGPPEGVGTKYLELADLIGDQAQSFPICLANYAPALEPLHAFIQTLVHTIYSFTLGENEEVTEVKISRAGSILPVAPSDYEIVGAQIRFDEGSIQENDELILRVRKTIP